MQLGNNINKKRKEKGLSQEKLAERINVTRQTISNWELGETYPNPEQLILLSREFEISIDDLVGNGFSKSADKSLNFNNLYYALAIICGAIVGIWAFTANRFRYDEILLIIIAGLVIGFCTGIVFHIVIKHIKGV